MWKSEPGERCWGTQSAVVSATGPMSLRGAELLLGAFPGELILNEDLRRARTAPGLLFVRTEQVAR